MIWLNENSLAIAVQEALPHIVYHSALHGPKISTRLDNISGVLESHELLLAFFLCLVRLSLTAQRKQLDKCNYV